MKAHFRPSAVACKAKRWHARPASIQCIVSSRSEPAADHVHDPHGHGAAVRRREGSRLRDQERAGHVGKGTTLHGLRVSYAAWWLRNGATVAEVTDLIGDLSERMGRHYTRHVESEININRAFKRVQDKT
jgi:hypothetical protein